MPAATSVLPPPDYPVYPHRDRDPRRPLSTVARIVHVQSHPPAQDPYAHQTMGSVYEHASAQYTHTYMPERVFPPSSLSLTFPSQFPAAPAHYSHASSSRSGTPQDGWAYPAHAQWQPLPAGHSPGVAHVNVSVNVTAPPPPPPVAHKVWLLDCKNCRTFLTNRGMKAVLLLRPNVPLYSTDALPVNCSAHAATPVPVLPSRRPSAEPPRTCECLTQTLCCHGCGNGVGYMIVIPCARCTSSISATNRSTNGHRFVFHSSEIAASERHYVPGEPGVLPAYTQQPAPAQQPPLPPSAFSSATTLPSPAPSPSSSGSSLPSSPISFLPDSRFRTPSASPGPAPDTPASMPPLMSPDAMPMPYHSPFPVAPAPALADGHKPSAHPLRTGDVLHWHHMARNGEIPGVADDRRARGRRAAVALDR
ncbi:hypothetical protein DENSPDRAFT_884588 [Dentipellis sp. KUC8613]|nr:hypothetical protein DENSPDRAFT_884588 [Dentipellis sp. KUC8613]